MAACRSGRAPHDGWALRWGRMSVRRPSTSFDLPGPRWLPRKARRPRRVPSCPTRRPPRYRPPALPRKRPNHRDQGKNPTVTCVGQRLPPCRVENVLASGECRTIIPPCGWTGAGSFGADLAGCWCARRLRVGLELSGEDHGSIDSVGSARWARGGFCGLLELGFCAAAGCSQTCRDDARVPSDYRTCNYSRRADNGDDSGRDDSGRDDPGRDDPGGNSAGSASCGTCWYRRSADRSSRADASATRCTASRHRLGRPRCQDGWRHVPSASA